MVRLLIVLLLTLSTSPGWARAKITAVKVSPQFRPFSERVKAYMGLYDHAEKAIGPLKDKSDAVQLNSHKRALAEAIRTARADAKQGDVFVPEVRPLFKQVIGSEASRKKDPKMGKREKSGRLQDACGGRETRARGSVLQTGTLASGSAVISAQPAPDGQICIRHQGKS